MRHRTGWNKQLLHQEEHSSVLGNIRDLRCFVPDIDQLQPRNPLNTSDMTLACAFAFNGSLHLFCNRVIHEVLHRYTLGAAAPQLRNSRLSYDFRSIA